MEMICSNDCTALFAITMAARIAALNDTPTSDGAARVLEEGDRTAEEAIASLVERYPQYRLTRPAGPVIDIAVSRWSGWSANHPSDR